MEATEMPDTNPRPRLTLRVGVTGHLPEKPGDEPDKLVNRLLDDEIATVTAQAQTVFDCLTAAMQALHTGGDRIFWSAERPDMRLVCSLAEGADTILAEAALATEQFRLDVVLPFPREDFVTAQGFDAGARARFDRLVEHTRRNALLELDADYLDERAASLAYLGAGRRVYGHSDILIAVWKGAPAAGTGGTAQVLEEALRTGLPVIRLNPSDGRAQLLTSPDDLKNADDLPDLFSENGRCAEVLKSRVTELLAPPPSEFDRSEESKPSARARLSRFYDEETADQTRRVAFSALRWLLVELPKNKEKREPFRWQEQLGGQEQMLKENWPDFLKTVERTGDTDFAAALKDRLAPRWARADRIALYYSHSYRSAYVLNFLLAAMAVIAGLTGIVWWTAETAISLQMKAVFVGIELAMILAVLYLTAHAREANRSFFWLRLGKDWHNRFLDARTVAELLRMARLPVGLGIATGPPLVRGSDSDAWVEWYVRACMREIPPPTARLDAKYLHDLIETAIRDEIDYQIRYNEAAAASYEKLDHRLHVYGEWLFLGTLVVGVAFLLYFVAFELAGAAPLKASVKSAVTFLGAGLPALGAALNGIRAMGDFKVAAEQAGRTGKELIRIKKALQRQHESKSPDRVQIAQLFNEASRALSTDVREWAKIYQLRELGLPA